MPSLFSGPPQPPPAPKIQPPRNTALTAQLQAQARRQGSNAAVMQQQGPSGSLLTHSLTGS